MDLRLIPGGITSKDESANVSCNKPFKEAEYNNRIASEENTPGGNVWAPSRLFYLQW